MTSPKDNRLPPLVPRYLSVLRAAKFITNPIPVLDSHLRQFGPNYLFHIGGFKKGFLTTDPEIIQHVLQKNHRNYRKSDIQTGLLAHYIGNGLLTSEGEYWLKQRRLIQPGFHRKRLASLVGLMNLEIQLAIKRWTDLATQEAAVDIYKEMHLLAFRIVAKTLFSTGLDEPRMEKLSAQITQVQKFIVKQIRQPYAHWWFKISGQIGQHEEISQATKQILIDIISTRMQSGVAHDDLLQMLLDARYEETGESMTLQQLLDECLIIFVAGHETTANALSWAFYLLAKNPRHIDLLRQESSSWMTEKQPLFEHLPRLTYTHQVIEEVMRLYPPAWIIDRVAQDQDEAGGFRIAKGTMMILYTYGTHHNPGLWPKQDQFEPERFNEERRSEIHPFAYFPFGGGPRLCIGNNFALMEMQLILTQLFHHFDFELISQKVEMLPLITLRPEKALMFRIRNRPVSGVETKTADQS
ncbi:MAG: cytochrome P450 [Saprospiraceae bacterium]|nr:cytochrome P450 [Saprospiraceae bacterium]